MASRSDVPQRLLRSARSNGAALVFAFATVVFGAIGAAAWEAFGGESARLVLLISVAMAVILGGVEVTLEYFQRHTDDPAVKATLGHRASRVKLASRLAALVFLGAAVVDRLGPSAVHDGMTAVLGALALILVAAWVIGWGRTSFLLPLAAVLILGLLFLTRPDDSGLRFSSHYASAAAALQADYYAEHRQFTTSPLSPAEHLAWTDDNAWLLKAVLHGKVSFVPIDDQHLLVRVSDSYDTCVQVITAPGHQPLPTTSAIGHVLEDESC
jgi:hypothetical protein